MKDEELLELARIAGWSGCDPAIKEKLLAFGRLVVKRKNKKHRSQTASGKSTKGKK